MFYSWTDIEELGYSNVENFIKEQYNKNNIEEMISFDTGIYVKTRPNFPYPNIDCTEKKKKYAQCMIFSKVRLAVFPEQAFNEFCVKNKIQQEDIIQVSYNDGDIFLVYNKEL